MTNDKDPMGMAIAEYYKSGKVDILRVLSPQFYEDEIPLEALFRTYDEMPEIEKFALNAAKGNILDVGAGSGCHSLALQKMGKNVHAIDISPLSVKTMRERGVINASETDFWEVNEKYDTILMLMNGIGIVGELANMPRFFKHIDAILSPGGKLIIDSSDIKYVYENEDGSYDLPEDYYYGEVDYRMQYKNTEGDYFRWLYLDFNTLKSIANRDGFRVEMTKEGDHYDYLATITRNV